MRFWAGILVCLGLTVLGGAAPTGAQTAVSTVPTAGTAIGSVQSFTGAAWIVRAGQRLPVERGTRVQLHDALRTGARGTMAVVLRDDTALSIGSGSELVVEGFLFEPADGQFASLVKMLRGTLVYISGRINKLSPGAAKIETPVGVAAVRGTKVLIKVPETGRKETR